jgi:hypothetical protein
MNIIPQGPESLNSKWSTKHAAWEHILIIGNVQVDFFQELQLQVLFIVKYIIELWAGVAQSV